MLARATRLSQPRDRRYVGRIAGHRAVVRDFNAACSGAQVRVTIAPGVQLPLVLHSEDALRQVTRGAGLDDVPRTYNAALEVPRRVWRRLGSMDPKVRAFVAAHLRGRVTEVPIAVTATRLRMPYQCWELTRDGKPARPDRPGNPVDPSVLLGFIRDAPAQGRPPLC